MKSFIFASDLHGDQQCPDAVNGLYKFTKEFKPDVKIFGGDLFDFSPLMRSADPAEKNASMEADVEAGMEFLNAWKPNYFLLGNHDDRLWQCAEKHSIGIIRDTAKMGIKDITNTCRKLKCKILPYNVDKGVLELGIMTFVHGYFHGAVSACKQHALTFSKQGGCCVHGHIHSIQQFSVPRHKGGAALSAGCLTKTEMGWNRAKVNRLAHETGWAFGYYSNKSWAVYTVRKFDGEWLWPKIGQKN
jgi:UDP-2,3-diacylglucosamine pyrophosphatase LpxH